MAFCRRTASSPKKLAQHGIAFIGPRPEHLDAFGLKHRAREIAQLSHVPLLPGSGLIDTLEQAMEQAGIVGFPPDAEEYGGRWRHRHATLP